MRRGVAATDEQRVAERFDLKKYKYTLEGSPGKPEIGRLFGFTPSPVDLADLLN